MATQRCPKCKSDRIRQGYRHTTFFLKLFFRYNLLCNDCNWEFTGFAIPGTVKKKTKKRKSADEVNVKSSAFYIQTNNEILNSGNVSEEKTDEKKDLISSTVDESSQIIVDNNSKPKRAKVKKKMRVKLI